MSIYFPLDVYIINLREDYEKFKSLETKLLKYGFLSVKRLDACAGSTLSDDVCLKLTGDPNSLNNKGAVGCFISHVRAWEMMLASNSSNALFIEDDCEITPWDVIHGMTAPSDFDIVFTNDRAMPYEYDHDISTKSNFFPIGRSLERIAKRGFSIGTDSYLLSAKGATNLLRLIKKDYYGGHIDMRMLAYSLEPLDLSVLDGGVFSGHLSRLFDRVGGAGLVTYSMNPCLTIHTPTSNSARLREDQAGKSILRSDTLS